MAFATGIVLYNPDVKRLDDNVNSIIGQCDKVYMFDNGSRNKEDIEAALQTYGDVAIEYKRIDYNAGIAYALNRLCEMAEDDSYEWLITLDQDSVCPSNMVEEYNRYVNNSDVGMLCPSVVDRNKTTIVDEGLTPFEVTQCITSGSALKLSAWSLVGGFDEWMFIDLVDFDICHRIINAGYRILRIPAVRLCHEYGRITERRFLFWQVSVKNHPAFRKYYMARNTIYLPKKEHNAAGQIKSVFQCIKMLLIVLGYEDDKRGKIKAIIQGMIDGITRHP